MLASQVMAASVNHGIISDQLQYGVEQGRRQTPADLVKNDYFEGQIFRG